MTLGDILRERRERREPIRLTQREVARLVGVSTSAVRQWERDRKRPGRAALGQLARLYGAGDEELGRWVRLAEES